MDLGLIARRKMSSSSNIGTWELRQKVKILLHLNVRGLYFSDEHPERGNHSFSIFYFLFSIGYGTPKIISVSKSIFKWTMKNYKFILITFKWWRCWCWPWSASCSPPSPSKFTPTSPRESLVWLSTTNWWIASQYLMWCWSRAKLAVSAYSWRTR
jgi:hypothetical protein